MFIATNSLISWWDHQPEGWHTTPPVYSSRTDNICLVRPLQLFWIIFSSSPVIYWWAAVLTTPKSQKPVPLIDLQKNVTQLGPGKVEKQTNLVTFFSFIKQTKVSALDSKVYHHTFWLLYCIYRQSLVKTPS